MSVDMSIITPESCHLNWPLQEADIQFLGIGTLSQVKQSMRWVECIGPEGQKCRLGSYVANITVNLWGCDMLQQIRLRFLKIPTVPKTNVSRKDIISLPAILAVQEYKATKKSSEVLRALPLKWLTEKPI